MSSANAGSTRDPQLRVYMNLMALESLPQKSTGPQGSFQQKLEALKEAGFEGVQFASVGDKEQLGHCNSLGLGIVASGRINTPEEAAGLAEKVAGDGYECATLHVGWGLEDDDEAARLIESVLNAVQRWRVPLYMETHRATIFQDMWRTVNFVRRFPEIRINGDFSHWYTGQEMVYGGFEKKLTFIQPVLERVRFLHGRIGNPGCMQVRIEPDSARPPLYVEHFRQLWTLAFRNFLRTAQANDSICFAPELLAPDIYYARVFPIASRECIEESDRWEQSVLLKRMAEECFRNARCA